MVPEKLGSGRGGYLIGGGLLIGGAYPILYCRKFLWGRGLFNRGWFINTNLALYSIEWSISFWMVLAFCRLWSLQSMGQNYVDEVSCASICEALGIKCGTQHFFPSRGSIAYHSKASDYSGRVLASGCSKILPPASSMWLTLMLSCTFMY